MFEVLGAIVILGTAMVAGISLYGTQEQSFQAQLQSSRALQFLNREMERIRATEFESLMGMSATAVPEDPAYELSVTITDLTTTTREVAIVVTWVTGTGITRSESMHTLRCKGVGI